MSKAATKLVTDLCKDPEVVQAVSELMQEVAKREDVVNATGQLLAESSTKLFVDEEVIDYFTYLYLNMFSFISTNIF